MAFDGSGLLQWRKRQVVTKKEIVKTISEEIGLTQLKTKEIVQKTFDAIVHTLVEEGRIELRNFGVFEVKKRAARKARNPRTGQRVDVAEKYVVTFKPGKEMEERVRLLTERRVAREEAQASMATGQEIPAQSTALGGYVAPQSPPVPQINPATTESETPRSPSEGFGRTEQYAGKREFGTATGDMD